MIFARIVREEREFWNNVWSCWDESKTLTRVSLSLSLIYVRSLEMILGSLAKEAYVTRYIYWNIYKFISH